MKATIVPLTARAIEYVLAHLWERGRDELAAFNADRTFAGAVMRLAARDGRAWSINVGDVVVCACALEPVGQGGDGLTLFLATDDFERFYRPVTAAILQRLPVEADRLGMERLEIHSISNHPKTEAWFKVLGFRRDDSYDRTIPETGARVVCYRRHMKRRGHVLRVEPA